MHRTDGSGFGGGDPDPTIETHKKLWDIIISNQKKGLELEDIYDLSDYKTAQLAYQKALYDKALKKSEQNPIDAELKAQVEIYKTQVELWEAKNDPLSFQVPIIQAKLDTLLAAKRERLKLKYPAAGAEGILDSIGPGKAKARAGKTSKQWTK